MTRRRWIADEHESDAAALTGSKAAHLARVLRARVGQEFDISLGNEIRRGTITHVSDERVEFALGEEVHVSPSNPITLYLAVFKFDRFEWAVEKCTELGVGKIVPLISRRTETHLAGAAGKRAERWRRISVEAAQQSRRLAPPAIEDPVKLKQALADPAPLRIVLAENEEHTMLRDVVVSQPGSTIALAIGPEGGWTGDELTAFDQHGWRLASLGSTILRAETAAIASVAIATAFSD